MLFTDSVIIMEFKQSLKTVSDFINTIERYWETDRRRTDNLEVFLNSYKGNTIIQVRIIKSCKLLGSFSFKRTDGLYKITNKDLTIEKKAIYRKRVERLDQAGYTSMKNLLDHLKLSTII